jgi:hypothetical protein
MWLSEREVNEKNECAKYLIVMLYATIPVRIAHSDFYEQVDQQGWKRLELGDFSKAISRHPSFGDWKLNNYKIMALCHKSMNIRHIDLTFPGFNSIQLNF